MKRYAIGDLQGCHEEFIALLEALDFDPLDLERCEERLFAIRGLARKHGVLPDELSGFADTLRARHLQCDAMVCCMSAGEIMKFTALGRFRMDGEQKGPLALLKKLRGRDVSKVIRAQEKIRKLVPEGERIPQKERAKMVKEVTTQILARPSKLCNVVEHRNLKLVYRRYASLYFCLAVDDTENELIVLEIIQHYVEILDKYFGNVCELDLIFNFHKAYYILDEVLVAGELQETSKKLIARLVADQDQLVEAAKIGAVEADGTPLQNP